MANNYYTGPMFQNNPCSSQQFFPQPQGNVYLINNSLEVANVPMSGGISIALCTNENIMYLKSMQNGNPMFMAYRIIPYEEKKPTSNKDIASLEARVDTLEKTIASYEKNNTASGGKLNELI